MTLTYNTKIYFHTTPEEVKEGKRVTQTNSLGTSLLREIKNKKPFVLSYSTSCRERLGTFVENNYRRIRRAIAQLPIESQSEIINLPHLTAKYKLPSGEIISKAKAMRRSLPGGTKIFKAFRWKTINGLKTIITIKASKYLTETQEEVFNQILQECYSGHPHYPLDWLKIENQTLRMDGFCLPIHKLSALFWTWRFHDRLLGKRSFAELYSDLASRDSLRRKRKGHPIDFQMGYYFYTYFATPFMRRGERYTRGEKNRVIIGNNSNSFSSSGASTYIGKITEMRHMRHFFNFIMENRKLILHKKTLEKFNYHPLKNASDNKIAFLVFLFKVLRENAKGDDEAFATEYQLSNERQIYRNPYIFSLSEGRN